MTALTKGTILLVLYGAIGITVVFLCGRGENQPTRMTIVLTLGMITIASFFTMLYYIIKENKRVNEMVGKPPKREFKMFDVHIGEKL